MTLRSVALSVTTNASVLMSDSCVSLSRRQWWKSTCNHVRFTTNRNYSSDVEVSSSTTSQMSKAMKLYIQRAKAHEEFMKKEKFAYELGKRHLANMMGEDVELFTQKDVDRAIRYLFPSGLYEPRARPVMKPPEDIYPPSKAAQFDVSGRPFHHLFYTRRPVFYQHLHDVANQFEVLNKMEDEMIRRGEDLTPKQDEELNWSSRVWYTKEELEEKFVEKVFDQHYEDLIKTLDRLILHPLSYKAKDLLIKFSKEKLVLSVTEAIQPLLYDENSRPYQKMPGRRKSCNAEVIVRGYGTGKVEINGKDISYFSDWQSREQIMFPLTFTNMLGKVDIEAVATGGGQTGQSGAIRLGLSRCLMSFVSEDMVEDMRQAGLLTQDRRRNERKKPGQPGARKKPTWKKR